VCVCVSVCLCVCVSLYVGARLICIQNIVEPFSASKLPSPTASPSNGLGTRRSSFFRSMMSIRTRRESSAEVSPKLGSGRCPKGVTFEPTSPLSPSTGSVKVCGCACRCKCGGWRCVSGCVCMCLSVSFCVRLYLFVYVCVCLCLYVSLSPLSSPTGSIYVYVCVCVCVCGWVGVLVGVVGVWVWSCVCVCGWVHVLTCSTQPSALLEGHFNSVGSVAFSQQDGYFASGGGPEDGFIRLFNKKYVLYIDINMSVSVCF
jgi:hypothetical protein